MWVRICTCTVKPVSEIIAKVYADLDIDHNGYGGLCHSCLKYTTIHKIESKEELFELLL